MSFHKKVRDWLSSLKIQCCQFCTITRFQFLRGVFCNYWRDLVTTGPFRGLINGHPSCMGRCLDLHSYKVFMRLSQASGSELAPLARRWKSGSASSPKIGSPFGCSSSGSLKFSMKFKISLTSVSSNSLLRPRTRGRRQSLWQQPCWLKVPRSWKELGRVCHLKASFSPFHRFPSG